MNHKQYITLRMVCGWVITMLIVFMLEYVIERRITMDFYVALNIVTGLYGIIYITIIMLEE